MALGSSRSSESSKIYGVARGLADARVGADERPRLACRNTWTGAQLAEHFRGAVGRAVVDDEDLVRLAGCASALSMASTTSRARLYVGMITLTVRRFVLRVDIVGSLGVKPIQAGR